MFLVAELTVNNAVSSVRTSLSVTVLPPLPRGLQLLPRGQSPRHTPSCLKQFLFTPDPTPNTPATADWRNGKGQRVRDSGSRGYEHDGGRGSATVDSVYGHVKSDVSAAERDWGESSLAGFRSRTGLEDRRTALPGKRRDDGDDQAMVAAFAGERWQLWAGVKTGAESRFQVRVVDRLSQVVVRHRFTVTQPAACVAPGCHAVVQVSAVFLVAARCTLVQPV